MNMAFFMLNDTKSSYSRYSYLYGLYYLLQSFAQETRQEFLSRITLGRYEHFHSIPNVIWDNDDILLALWDEANRLKDTYTPLNLNNEIFYKELVALRENFHALSLGTFSLPVQDAVGGILQSIDWYWESGDIEQAKKDFNTLTHIYVVTQKHPEKILPLFKEIDILKHGIKKGKERIQVPYQRKNWETWLSILQWRIDDVLADNILPHD